MPRYLGIDLGEKRIGLSISDPTLTIAQPLKTLRFRSMKGLIAEVKEIVDQYDVCKVVIGLPLTLKGTFSQKTDEIVSVAEELGKALDPLPVEMYDERLTTMQAHSTLRTMGKKPSQERDRVDQLAAMHLLQNYLDREKTRRQMNENES